MAIRNQELRLLLSLILNYWSLRHDQTLELLSQSFIIAYLEHNGFSKENKFKTQCFNFGNILMVNTELHSEFKGRPPSSAPYSHTYTSCERYLLITFGGIDHGTREGSWDHFTRPLQPLSADAPSVTFLIRIDKVDESGRGCIASPGTFTRHWNEPRELLHASDLCSNTLAVAEALTRPRWPLRPVAELKVQHSLAHFVRPSKIHMPGEDIVLYWRFPPPQDGHDMRTFSVYLDLGPSHEALHLYKFLTIAGMADSSTTFERWNINARRWEIAGEIHWNNNFTGEVKFGIYTLPLRDVRRRKKQSSKSRRFVVNNAEYKWKVKDNGRDLFCVNADGETVATWTEEILELRVAASAEDILDRLVVTCLVHIWFKAHGYW
ncbi:uncharacterized protein FOMMEDRAFT_147698 [Fomitiporia mediterranea MF3/22]|uniref:uncharacterized protein n=1 Tax=Fomitiporia mediterranea (strain MF3/22) TaxID=694068 RepID=UPI00044077E3|nr:uncharacterized protein FOMMEDRAFT_147698 [Fomitiporia mediterranea MF3/22]EJD01040.1 hypothetical protein FOMMEDRAFT_147698 [Fomitiporia mediterranea MF3/22]